MANKILEEAKVKFQFEGEKTTFVGVHYRGTDYIDFLIRNHGNSFKVCFIFLFHIFNSFHFIMSPSNKIFKFLFIFNRVQQLHCCLFLK